MWLPSCKNIEVFQASISERFMIFHSGSFPEHYIIIYYRLKACNNQASNKVPGEFMI